MTSHSAVQVHLHSHTHRYTQAHPTLYIHLQIEKIKSKTLPIGCCILSTQYSMV